MESEDEIKSRIVDFESGIRLAHAFLRPYHTFQDDICRTIKNCEDNLVILKAKLLKIQENNHRK